MVKHLSVLRDGSGLSFEFSGQSFELLILVDAVIAMTVGILLNVESKIFHVSIHFTLQKNVRVLTDATQ